MSKRKQNQGRRRTIKRLLLACTLVFCLLIPIGFVCTFPGQQASIAFTLATGLHVSSLQSRIDELEDKAIRRDEFTAGDKAFLVDFYTCLAKGAKLTIVLRQSGRLMDRYLDASGDPLELNKSIFTKNMKVRGRMKKLRGKIAREARSDGRLEKKYSSARFHMPHPSSPDSVFGLYFGRVTVKPRLIDDTKLHFTLRAEVPWEWPSYDSLHKKYGDYHAENFPLPNILTLLVGPLYVDNGLGEYLVQLGLAKPFIAYSEWDEVVTIP